MPREKLDYRDLLMRLDEAFPQQETLTRQDVAAWLGVSRNTVARRYKFPAGRVTKTQVARSVATSK